MSSFETREQLLDGLKFCDEACKERPCEGIPFLKVVCAVKLDAFKLNGQWFAYVVCDEDGRSANKRKAYVVFRGTELTGWGTWVFTNAQAASIPFLLPEPLFSLNARSISSTDNVSLPKPVLEGRIHQGFLRAWCWLWYGRDLFDEPVKTLMQTILEHKLQYSVLLLSVMSATAALLSLSGWRIISGGVAALTSAAAALVVTWAIQSGRFEKLFWKKVPPRGESLQKQMPNLRDFDEVWFIGHSLGAGLATIAFSAYRNWCAINTPEKINGKLLTFACPMVGDKIFVRSFERQHENHYLHVMDDGDPVTYLPPGSLSVLLRRLPIPLSATGLLIVFLPITWCVIAVFWRQRFYDTWRSKGGVWRLRGRPPWIWALKHTRESYRTRIRDFPYDRHR